ncbi:MAG: helix-turn-helix transcriptional regulator [Clostridia bacterium]|nr:helix-turn-helix transcriptional regulator [Clostridia bacterium]
MFKIWDDVTIKSIRLAMYVPAGTGEAVHNNRPTHGFVINDEGSAKTFTFSNGTVLNIRGADVIYLPKGSSYRVTADKKTGCYAINFDTAEDIDYEPFCISFRDNNAILKCFKNAEKNWRQRPDYYRSAVLKNIYEIINLIGKEYEREYLTNQKQTRIESAVKKIQSSFTDSALSVAELAKECGISEAYFRRLFIAKFGVPPKEYITRLRINYAKRLLKSGDFSVSNVASLSGYYEPCHFSREFKKHTGLTPAKYKYAEN